MVHLSLPVEVQMEIQNWLLLAIRLLIAVVFIHEAHIKLSDLEESSKIHGFSVDFMRTVAFLQILVVVSMLTGVLTLISGIGLGLLMLITTFLQIFKYHSPYWANKYGYEYDLMILVFAVVIVVYGPGDFTLLKIF